jgi:hypothetical protein
MSCRFVRPLDLHAALAELDDDQRTVIRSRLGLDGEPLNDDEVAEKFGWDVEWNRKTPGLRDTPTFRRMTSFAACFIAISDE